MSTSHGSSAMLAAAACILLAFAPLMVAGLTDKGILYLDDLTFDRVVTGRDHVLVRFDKEYPWGDAHEAFKEVAAAVGESGADALVAGVPISNRQEYLVNPRLARRFGVDKANDDDFPYYRLFLKGADVAKPLAYSGPLTKAALSAWLVEHTGVFIGLKGQLQAMDAAAKRLIAAPAAERAALLKQLQDEAGKLELTAAAQKDYVEYYVKTMQRVVDKGDAYVITEAARLAKMAADKGVAPAKREAFEWKANVLASFKPAKGGAAKDGKTEL